MKYQFVIGLTLLCVASLSSATEVGLGSGLDEGKRYRQYADGAKWGDLGPQCKVAFRKIETSLRTKEANIENSVSIDKRGPIYYQFRNDIREAGCEVSEADFTKYLRDKNRSNLEGAQRSARANDAKYSTTGEREKVEMLGVVAAGASTEARSLNNRCRATSSNWDGMIRSGDNAIKLGVPGYSGAKIAYENAIKFMAQAGCLDSARANALLQAR
jgi:hypothetical protein